MRAEYKFIKTLSSLGIEVILLKHKKLTVYPVNYRRIHYNGLLGKWYSLNKKNILALSNFLWSFLEARFSDIMLKFWVKSLQINLTANTVLGIIGKSIGGSDLLLITSSSVSSGEDGL